MSKKKLIEIEPELSHAGTWASVLTLSLAGAGLPDDLEQRAERSGLEVDRFTGVAQVRADDLGVLLGDRASEIREVLDDSDLATEAEAAAEMGIGQEVVLGLCQRRGCPTTVGAGGEVLVSRRLWQNLCRLLAEERRAFDGEFATDDIDWTIRTRPVTESLENAAPGFVWEDPFFKPVVRKPRVLRALEAALQEVTGAPSPEHETSVRSNDWDSKYRAVADRVGVRYSTIIGARIRPGCTGFLGWDLFRICGLVPNIRAARSNEQARIDAYARLTNDSYLSCFPTAVDHTALRAELIAKSRRSELVSV
jgi:hypothetical protein